MQTCSCRREQRPHGSGMDRAEPIPHSCPHWVWVTWALCTRRLTSGGQGPGPGLQPVQGWASPQASWRRKPPSAGQAAGWVHTRREPGEWGVPGSPLTGSTSAGRSDTASPRSPAAAIFEAFSSHPPQRCCCRGCRSGQRSGGQPQTAASAAAAPYPCPDTTEAPGRKEASWGPGWSPRHQREHAARTPAGCPPI